MRILIAGNMGYVGSVLIPHLRRVFPHSELVGFDTGFFATCTTTDSIAPEIFLNKQLFGDIRNITTSTLIGFDAIVMLAAISNDPMGNRFEEVTNSINYLATSELLNKAVNAGVSRFAFASSCSIYGAADGNAKKEVDELNPLTAYARSKVAVEKALSAPLPDNFVTTSLRFSTACGFSSRLRLDLVLNDFVANAMMTNEIKVLSDGSPWRPLIDVHDMAKAVEWALTRDPKSSYNNLTVNIGSDDRNYQVKDLALAVQSTIPGTNLSINKAALPDKRSYKVDFSLFKSLAPDHQPSVSLVESINQLYDGLRSIGFNDTNFRNSKLIRLKVLEDLVNSEILNKNLLWN